MVSSIYLLTTDLDSSTCTTQTTHFSDKQYIDFKDWKAKWKVAVDYIPAPTSLTSHAQSTSQQSEHSLAQLNTMVYPYWQQACGSRIHTRLRILHLNLGSHTQIQIVHNPWGRHHKFMANDGAFSQCKPTIQIALAGIRFWKQQLPFVITNSGHVWDLRS